MKGKEEKRCKCMSNKSNNNINIYGNVSGIQIQQNSNDSIQMQECSSFSESNVEKYQAVLDQIGKYQAQFKDEFGEKSDDLIASLEQAQEALDKKDESKWKKAINVIKDIAAGATGSLIATGILGLLAQII